MPDPAHLGIRANDHSLGHIVHRIGVSGLSDPDDLAVLDSNICLEDARPVDDEGVGDDQVEYFGIGPVGRLTLSVSQGFA
jgi:hypothetical protein